MIDTLQDQIAAAGGTWTIVPKGKPAPPCTSRDILLLVNNFSTKKQLEAPDQPLNGTKQDFKDFEMFLNDQKCLIGFADNRYSNGADIFFVEWIFDTKNTFSLTSDRFCYAGWNTDGNTLGTVISNIIILNLYGYNNSSNNDNTGSSIDNNGDILRNNGYFNSLRILEDNYYQAIFRQELSNYVDHVRGDSTNTLNTDLEFYKRYTWKRLNSDYYNINSHYNNENIYALRETYFPWNRTFEIGFISSVTNIVKEDL